MDSAESKRALDILDGAHGLSEEELESYLDQVCGENSLLRREVLGYLDYDVEHTVISVGADGDSEFELPAATVSETRYELGEEIASGGVGVILRAYDNNIRRRVAIKVLREKWENDPDVIRRFVQEAQIAGQLQHPGIAPVYEIGRLPDRRPFIAMKLVKGATLEELLARRHDPAEDQAKFLGIFEQICQAIAFAHQRGVIHRDLKPSNVMVGEFGEVQVMDWGIAKLLDDKRREPLENEDPNHADTTDLGPEEVETDASGHSTKIGDLMGTPAYMAPEQCIGRADKTADVFSLGAILLEILTGQKTPKNLDDVGKQLDPCHGCDELAELARTCLQTNEVDRPPNAGAVAEKISAHLNAIQGRLQEAEIASARAEVKAEEERKRRYQTLWAVAIVATVLLAAGLLGIVVRRRASERQLATQADALVNQLLIADIQRVPAIVEEIETCRDRVTTRLSTEFEQSEPGSVERLHLALALPHGDERRVPLLRDRLLTATPKQFPVVQEALGPHRNQILESVWQHALTEQHAAVERFRAAAALAEFDSGDERWNKLAPFVARQLTSADVYLFLGQWLQQLRPARQHLTETLATILVDRGRSQRQREVAAVALADYWQEEPDQLAKMILVADEVSEFGPLMKALQSHRSAVHQQLTKVMHSVEPDRASKPESEAHWRRQSLAAVALVQLGHGDRIWPLLRLTPDPSLRCLIIDDLARLQTDHNPLAERLAEESDVSVRRALIQCLGSLERTLIPDRDRIRIAAELQTLYANDTDPGIHSSASWALRQWGETLPPLPPTDPIVSELVVSGEQRQRMVDWGSARQATWEKHLQENPPELSESLGQGLIAHFPFDQSESAAKGSQISGTYQGFSEPQWVPGIVDQALQLEGDGSYIQCDDGFNPERTDAFSFGCWFSADSDLGEMSLFHKIGRLTEGTGRGGFNIQIKPGRVIATWTHQFPENRLALIADVPDLLSRWHHIFVTYDGSSTAEGAAIYVDGQRTPFRVLTDSLTGSIQNAGALRIGGGQNSSSFRAWIDDLRLYERDVAEDEVRALYHAGIVTVTRIPDEDRTAEQQALLTSAFNLAVSAPLQPDLQSKLAEVEKTLMDQWQSMRRWYVNSQGQTMMVVANPPTGSETGVDRDFAICAHEVTVAEFRRFREEHEVDELVAPSEDCPVHDVTWDMAAEYCNWLSAQDGIPETQWVYEPGPDGGMVSKDDALDLLGYRLPTAEEWQTAYLAGTDELLRFNMPTHLVSRSAHFESSFSIPVASLLPNDLGLFDMYGNVWEICHNKLVGLSTGRARLLGQSYKMNRLLRGTSREVLVKAGDAWLHSIGFRVARTQP